MPQQQTQTDLLEAIEHSVLLSFERKTGLQNILPKLTETQAKQLSDILASEDTILTELAHTAITRAVERGDEKFLTELETFLGDAIRRLRKAEEGAAVSEEQKHADHLFDESP